MPRDVMRLGPRQFRSSATNPSPASRRCCGVQLRCNVCATSRAVPEEHTKAVRGALPDDPGPVKPLPPLHSGVERISCGIGDHIRAALLLGIASEG